MDTPIQYRVGEETKHFAHDAWLTEQVNAAFEKLDSGKANFIQHEEAKVNMEARKLKIRTKARA